MDRKLIMWVLQKNIVFPFVIIAENLQIEVNFMMYWIHIETIISKN